MPLNPLSMNRIVPGGDPMNGENETRKLLEFKATLENRLKEIETEMADIRKALEHIDGIIINTGFRTFSVPDPPKPAPQLDPVIEPEAPI